MMTSSPAIRVRTFPSRQALDEALGARLAASFEHPWNGAAAIMLSGGSTPLNAYRALANRPLTPAEGLWICYSDERYVPETSEASNYHTSRPLLDKLALPADRVLRVRTELALEEAAADYEHRVLGMLGAGVRIELGLLGLGADGHTASLFSEADLARAAGRMALAVQRPDGRGAVSVAPALLEQIAEPLFVVAGADKRTALRGLVEGDPRIIAARAVAGCTNVEVWTEPEAWPIG
jgi:6-phosphogluconolactonase